MPKRYAAYVSGRRRDGTTVDLGPYLGDSIGEARRRATAGARGLRDRDIRVVDRQRKGYSHG